MSKYLDIVIPESLTGLSGIYAAVTSIGTNAGLNPA